MKAPLVVLAVCALCACGKASDPVSATKEFLAAVNAAECDKAFRLYSSGTQKNIRDEVRRIEREADFVTPGTTPETRYCQGSYGDYKRGSARLVSADEKEATVAVTFSQGTHLALIPFLSTPYKEYPGEIRLTKEGTEWRVERPRVAIGRKGWELVEVGAVDVFYSQRGDGRRRSFEATKLSSVPREALQGTLAEPAAWAQLLPRLERLEVLQSDPPLHKVRLRFAGFDQAVEVSAKAYGNLVDRRLPWSTLQWGFGEARTGVLYVGSWKLRPGTRGTWITFGLVIDPRQWPEGVAERILAPEQVAAAIAALEARAAGKREPGPS